MTEKDTAVEELLDAAAAPYHTILELWRGVLAPAVGESEARITPQWANRIVSTYQGVGFADMTAFRAVYFAKVLDLAAILEEEIEQEPECLHPASAEEDRETNSLRYLNIMILWQSTFLLWELEWDPDSPAAGIEIAAMAEVHRMFFGEEGILGLLDQIKFEFTDEHRQMLVDVLEETRREAEGA
jgi:hypothetical protein